MNCQNCNLEFQSKDYRQKFCSKRCSALVNNKLRPRKDYGDCIVCGKKRTRNTVLFCSNKCQHAKKLLDRINSGEFSSRTAKLYLVKTTDNQCSICGIKDWRGKPLVKILDHIDGNSENTQLSNLRLVCSNCDSQLPTYKAKNKGNGRYSRRKRYLENKSY